MRNKLKVFMMLSLPMVLAMSSCTVMQIDVNKAPEEVKPTSEEEDKKEDEENNDEESSNKEEEETSSDKQDSSTSEIPSISLPDVSYTDLNYEQTQELINNLITHIEDIHEYDAPKVFKLHNEKKYTDPSKNGTVIDADINFNNMTFYSDYVEKSVGVPTILGHRHNWIYKVKEEDKVISAEQGKRKGEDVVEGDVTIPGKPIAYKEYKTIVNEAEQTIKDAWLTEVNNKSILMGNLVPFEDNIIKDATLSVLKALRVDEKIYHLADEVTVKSSGEGNMEAKFRIDRTVLGAKIKADLEFKIENYSIVYNKSVNALMTDSTTYTYYETMEDIPTYKYPNLDGFTCLDTPTA